MKTCMKRLKTVCWAERKNNDGKIFGRDLDDYAFDVAAADNIERSMFDDVIRLKRADFFQTDPPSEKGLDVGQSTIQCQDCSL